MVWNSDPLVGEDDNWTTVHYHRGRQRNRQPENRYPRSYETAPNDWDPPQQRWRPSYASVTRYPTADRSRSSGPQHQHLQRHYPPRYGGFFHPRQRHPPQRREPRPYGREVDFRPPPHRSQPRNQYSQPRTDSRGWNKYGAPRRNHNQQHQPQPRRQRQPQRLQQHQHQQRQPQQRPAPRNRPDRTEYQQSDDPDFTIKVRALHRLLKATHHLNNVSQKDRDPPAIQRITINLAEAIKPANPSIKTLDLIDGNARNWAFTTMCILRQHYQDVQEEEKQLLLALGGDMLQPLEVAVKWAKRNLGKRFNPSIADDVQAYLLASDEDGAPPSPAESPAAASSSSSSSPSSRRLGAEDEEPPQQAESDWSPPIDTLPPAWAS